MGKMKTNTEPKAGDPDASFHVLFVLTGYGLKITDKGLPSAGHLHLF